MNPTKCEICLLKIDFPGHRIGNDMCQPKDEKIRKIANALPHWTKKQVRSFLGLTGYYRDFIIYYCVS